MLERLLQLRGHTFEFKESVIEKGLGSPGKQTRFIAQEVAEVFPDWIGRTTDDFLHITERGTTALLVEALRELDSKSNEAEAALIERNQVLNEENEILEAEVALLREEVAALTDTANKSEERLTQIESLLNPEKIASH